MCLCVDARARFRTTFVLRENASFSVYECISMRELTCAGYRSGDNYVHACVYNVMSMFGYASGNNCTLKCVI